MTDAQERAREAAYAAGLVAAYVDQEYQFQKRAERTRNWTFALVALTFLIVLTGLVF